MYNHSRTPLCFFLYYTSIGPVFHLSLPTSSEANLPPIDLDKNTTILFYSIGPIKYFFICE